ncbi:hypothetical protein G5C51_04670 [Streptomyces sp. A7024]|uniref:SAF domain-containing protein n=2 Tax=Streptomyces coryli TaxID=1128680 RepID=A0A6G4TTU8_9ACTN|nr:hypothetical protein [Streptomyces coryli]
MSAPPSPASPPSPRNGSSPMRPASVPVTTSSPVRRQRRWALVAVGLVLAALGALVAMAAVNNAGNRQQVLVLAADVPLGQKIESGDLKVVSVSADPALEPVKAGEKDQVVGRSAKVGLVKGSMLTQGQLTSKTAGDDKQVVGVQAKRGQMPSGVLEPGDQVALVTTPAEGEDVAEKTPSKVIGTVVSVSDPDPNGAVVVNVAVSPTEGPTVAARAAADRIALVREPRS